MAEYIKNAKEVEQVLIDFMIWTLKSVPGWNVDRHTNRSVLIGDWTFSLLQSSKQTDQVCGILEHYLVSMTDESIDLDNCSTALGGIIEGLLKGRSTIEPSSYADVLQVGMDLLASNIFDLREFFVDVPVGSCVDEILQRHYGLLLSVIELLSLLLHGAEEVDDAFLAKVLELKCLVLEYCQVITAFILKTSCEEHFLVKVVAISTVILIHTYVFNPE